MWRQQLREATGLSIRPGEIRAYQEGTIGWVADQPTFSFADGITFTARFTAVARREDGAWRLVQAHASVGVANEDLLDQNPAHLRAAPPGPAARIDAATRV